jgi:hypothetical protein
MPLKRRCPVCRTLLRRPCTGSGPRTTAAPFACASACIPRQTPSTGTPTPSDTISNETPVPKHQPSGTSRLGVLLRYGTLCQCLGLPCPKHCHLPTSCCLLGVPGPGETTTLSKSRLPMRALMASRVISSLRHTTGGTANKNT